MVHLNLSIYYYNKIKNICQIVQHLESNIVDERFNILSFKSVTYFFYFKNTFSNRYKNDYKKECGHKDRKSYFPDHYIPGGSRLTNRTFTHQ